jgi:hypothetical protein
MFEIEVKIIALIQKDINKIDFLKYINHICKIKRIKVVFNDLLIYIIKSIRMRILHQNQKFCKNRNQGKKYN